MDKLYIAEKPSQAQDIGKVLGIRARREGYLELTNGDVITWARGHLISAAEPEDYNPDWKFWKWDHLPMLPQTWLYKPNRATSGQLTVIKKLLKTARCVVIATDAGREGELIGREILAHAKYRGPVKRLWTSSLVEADIRKALAALKDGAETEPLYEAALARQRADWMHGLSGTRAVTLAAQANRTVFPLGRVQTPVLALMVRRLREIQSFSAKTYYELEARVRTAAGAEFTMMHAPDEAHRITDRKVAEALKAKAAGHCGPIKVEKVAGRERAPMPYSLPTLQKDANRVLGFSAKRTLDIAQALYEKKVSTYPRTDCTYLAASQMAQVTETLDCVRKTYPAAVAQLEALGVEKRAEVFDDAKLTDHHGIIPTSETAPLSPEEGQLYGLICQRYLQMLGPACQYEQTKVALDANGVPFKATGRVVTVPGWTAIKVS